MLLSVKNGGVPSTTETWYRDFTGSAQKVPPRGPRDPRPRRGESPYVMIYDVVNHHPIFELHVSSEMFSFSKI